MIAFIHAIVREWTVFLETSLQFLTLYSKKAHTVYSTRIVKYRQCTAIYAYALSYGDNVALNEYITELGFIERLLELENRDTVVAWEISMLICAS